MKISTYLFLLLAVFTNNHSYGCSPQLSEGEYLSNDLLKYLKEFKIRKKDPPNGLLGMTVKKEGIQRRKMDLCPPLRGNRCMIKKQYQPLMNITADNIRNMGGTLSADKLNAVARQDINNTGGTIEALSAANLVAGRVVNMTTTTQSSSASNKAIASSFSGNTTSIVANNNLTSVGTVFKGTDSLLVEGKNDQKFYEAVDQSSSANKTSAA